MAKAGKDQDVTADRIGHGQSFDFNASGMKLEEAKLFASNKVGDVRMKVRSPTEIIEKRQKINDFFNAAVALVSIIIVYYASEWFYKADNESDPQINSMRGINMIMTGCILIMIFIHHRYNLILGKLRRKYSPKATLYTTGMWRYVAIEMLLLGIFCPPYLDVEFNGEMLDGTYTYSIDGIISVFTILRIFLVFRLYKHVSVWTSPEAVKIAKLHNITPNLTFSFKADLKYRPHLLLLIIIGATVLCIGFIVRTLERSYESDGKSSIDFEYLTNGWWLTVVTMTTVGYGDGYPSTHLGRLIMIITAVLSLVVISLYVVALTLATMFTREETKAYYLIKKTRAAINVKEKAANCIKTAFRLNRFMRSTKQKPEHLKYWFILASQLRRSTHLFKKDTRVADSRYLPPAEMLIQLEQKLNTDIEDIKKEILDISYIGERLQDLRKDQAANIQQLNEIVMVQKEVEKDVVAINNDFVENSGPKAKNELT